MNISKSQYPLPNVWDREEEERMSCGDGIMKASFALKIALLTLLFDKLLALTKFDPEELTFELLELLVAAAATAAAAAAATKDEDDKVLDEADDEDCRYEADELLIGADELLLLLITFAVDEILEESLECLALLEVKFVLLLVDKSFVFDVSMLDWLAAGVLLVQLLLNW